MQYVGMTHLHLERKKISPLSLKLDKTSLDSNSTSSTVSPIISGVPQIVTGFIYSLQFSAYRRMIMCQELLWSCHSKTKLMLLICKGRCMRTVPKWTQFCFVFFVIKVHQIFERLTLRDKWLIASCFCLFSRVLWGFPVFQVLMGRR